VSNLIRASLLCFRAASEFPIDVAAGSCYSYDKKSSDFAPLVGQIGYTRGHGELGLGIWWRGLHQRGCNARVNMEAFCIQADQVFLPPVHIF
jgi:hypothetical protein